MPLMTPSESVELLGELEKTLTVVAQ
jgi:hypothetical protein